MSKQVSPFAALTGAEKQIRWLEYQSIRLPYVQTESEEQNEMHDDQKTTAVVTKNESLSPMISNENAPLPEKKRRESQAEMRAVQEFQKTRHSQYDAVIARMKQAEQQTKRFQNL